MRALVIETQRVGLCAWIICIAERRRNSCRRSSSFFWGLCSGHDGQVQRAFEDWSLSTVFNCWPEQDDSEPRPTTTEALDGSFPMLFVAPSVNDSGCSVAGGARVDSELGEFASPFSPRPLLAVS
ncbi:hypothetical protein VTJ04DRAFT_7354 [Mycothermus thermophilus]|uniref:uncharacterized protein n=1 Tax=Humicola insolens TaxID=85995 RepID=UPI003744534A